MWGYRRVRGRRPCLAERSARPSCRRRQKLFNVELQTICLNSLSIHEASESSCSGRRAYSSSSLAVCMASIRRQQLTDFHRYGPSVIVGTRREYSFAVDERYVFRISLYGLAQRTMYRRNTSRIQHMWCSQKRCDVEDVSRRPRRAKVKC